MDRNTFMARNESVDRNKFVDRDESADRDKSVDRNVSMDKNISMGRNVSMDENTPMERNTSMERNIRLLNDYCYLVNEVLLFIEKYFEGIVPAGKVEEDIYWRTRAVYEQVAAARDRGRQTESQCLLEDFLGYAASYWEAGRPWETFQPDRRACRNTVLNSVQLVANLAILLSPTPSHPAARVTDWLGLNGQWQVQSVHSGHELPQIENIVLEENYEKYSFHVQQDRVS